MMKAFLITLILLVAQFTFAQNVVYFPGFELINMGASDDLHYSTSKLIKSYIEDNHGYTILLDERVGSNGYHGKEPLSDSNVKAKQLEARFFMRGEIHFLQGIYIISLGVYETGSMKQVWHDMAKGAAEQDLDPLLSRLGRSFFTNKTAKTDIEIDEVTTYDLEGVALAQMQVNHFMGIMLGGKVLPQEVALSGLGLAYTYDASTFLFNLDFELYPTSNLPIDNHSQGRKIQNGTVSLGVSYPLTRKRTTFYLNGGMEYGFTTIKEIDFDVEYAYTGYGVGANLGGGLLINRNSTVNLRLFTAISIPFYSIYDIDLTGIKFGIVTSFARKR